MRVDYEYWIDTFGKVHKYKPDGVLYFDYDDPEKFSSIHSVIAQQLYPDSKDPKTVLLNLGWVLVGSVVYGSPISYKDPTQAQINTLDKLELLDYLSVSEEGDGCRMFKRFIN